MAFKDFFFKKDEEEVKPQPKPVNNRPVNVSTIPTMIVPTSTVASGTDYFKYFDDAIKKNMETGPCYKDFADSLDGLTGQPLSEPQKYTVVFTAFRTQGMTPDKLVQSAMRYNQLVEDVKFQFQRELAATKKAGVEDKMNAVKTLESDIQKLTEQIQAKSNQITQLNKEAAENAQQLSSEEAAFNNAYNTKHAIIENHINNIKTYLSANITKQPQG